MPTPGGGWSVQCADVLGTAVLTGSTVAGGRDGGPVLEGAVPTLVAGLLGAAGEDGAGAVLRVTVPVLELGVLTEGAEVAIEDAAGAAVVPEASVVLLEGVQRPQIAGQCCLQQERIQSPGRQPVPDLTSRALAPAGLVCLWQACTDLEQVREMPCEVGSLHLLRSSCSSSKCGTRQASCAEAG